MEKKTYIDEKDAVYTEDRKILMEAPRDMEEYVVPEGTERIAGEAFQTSRSSLRKIVLPETLKCISPFAFYLCSNLQEINIPDSVEEIGEDAFGCCTGLKEVVLPRHLKTMHGNPFSLCKVDIRSLSPHFNVEKGCLHGDNGKTLIRATTNEPSFSVKEGVEVIAKNALEIDVEELALPVSLKSVEGSDYSHSVKRIIWQVKPAEPLFRAVSKMFEGIETVTIGSHELRKAHKKPCEDRN